MLAGSRYAASAFSLPLRYTAASVSCNVAPLFTMSVKMPSAMRRVGPVS